MLLENGNQENLKSQEKLCERKIELLPLGRRGKAW